MYQIEIRLYEVNGNIQGYGQYSCETLGREELLATGKAFQPYDATSDDDLHDAMMSVASEVCTRIAQNISACLF